MWKKTGITGYVYDFSVDYEAIAVNDVKDIHKYLMEKNDKVWLCLSNKNINHNIKLEQ